MHPLNDMGQLLNLSAYQSRARSLLDPAIWQYLEHGASEEISLRANRTAFNNWDIPTRPLTNVNGGHTRQTLYGQELAHPILLAPIAYQRLFHEQGESASALAACAQGGQLLVSSLASQPLEYIAETSDSNLWFQLYWQGERERTLRLLRRAEAAGYCAIVFTIDAPVKQATLVLPAHIHSVNLESIPPYSAIKSDQSQVFDGWMAHAPTWDDVSWLRQQTQLPLILKGIIHPDDADTALKLGCDGIIVSNHGGRVLDGTPASLTMLPIISQRIAGQIPILFDSGIRNGRDIFKALALGASAVLIGRPYIWGLASAGAMGVAHILRLMRDELEMTMALSGCATLSDINSSKLFSNPSNQP
ncbi:alpha-hydroxy acid oxidase [Sulfuriferula nivalis]|uniref:Alpha-hydroxy-acid oxidizing enzyme n=1 Tax=Sulfuriferula nivalis TaxID=2675298 RepID=A0A809RKH5_9PROT|nr:alpha-hydroxy acid oxidase [Sulfuriferula nivalis]BBP01304.1 alpha-hydroxy-acid oxidizing enzyme [Sulfuriferula nivalis]